MSHGKKRKPGGLTGGASTKRTPTKKTVSTSTGSGEGKRFGSSKTRSVPKVDSPPKAPSPKGRKRRIRS